MGNLPGDDRYLRRSLSIVQLECVGVSGGKSVLLFLLAPAATTVVAWADGLAASRFVAAAGVGAASGDVESHGEAFARTGVGGGALMLAERRTSSARARVAGAARRARGDALEPGFLLGKARRPLRQAHQSM